MSAGAEDPPAVLAEVTAASAREHGMSPLVLDGYLRALLAVAGTGRRLTREEEAACRRLGGEAAARGTPLPAVVDLYMTASRRLWPLLPELLTHVRGRPFRSSELVGIGEAVWRAADTALAALASGYVEAQRDVVRREEAHRRQFVDDLLTGRTDLGSLVERAEHFGLTLTAAHLVVVVGTDRDVDSGMSVAGAVADAVRLRFGSRGLLVEAADGRLVCVLSSGPVAGRSAQDDGHTLAELCGPLVAHVTQGSRWRVGVGRSHQGPHGVLRSYREAVEALELGDRLDLAPPIVHARDLLVYRVLLRDEAAIADLVETVLGPLEGARGGAEQLVRTLEAYYDSGGNSAAAARRLFLSVRAVTYRLQRVQELTGYSAGDPAHHLPLLVAVTGARLLDWPRRRLTSAQPDS